MTIDSLFCTCVSGCSSCVQVQFLQRAVDVLCQCRRTLMYTYVFAFYLRRNNQSLIFEENQKDLAFATEQLSEYLERDSVDTLTHLMPGVRPDQVPESLMSLASAPFSVSYSSSLPPTNAARGHKPAAAAAATAPPQSRAHSLLLGVGCLDRFCGGDDRGGRNVVCSGAREHAGGDPAREAARAGQDALL